MTQQEIISSFQLSTQEMLGLLSSLGEDQLNKVPFEGSWTAAQVGDHLLKSYGAAETINGTTGPTQRAPDEKLGLIRETFLNFEVKFTSPDFILPSEDPIAKKPLLDGLREKLEQIQQTIEKKTLTETCLDFEFPGSGTLTRLEWIGFVDVHTQRHNRQLKNIIKSLSS